MPKAKEPEVVASDPVEALREENAALKAQNELVLDAVIELQEQMKTLQAGSTALAASETDEQDKLDAELEALLEEHKDYPAIQVFTQRVLIGVDANTAIRLAGDRSALEDPGGESCAWKLRWFNFAIEGRAQRASSEGYIKVLWDELADQDSVAAGDRTKPYVCKGERGQDVLCKMPMKLYAYKKKRDAARSQGLLTSESKLRDHVADGVASRAGRIGDNGSQAGDFAHAGMSMTITPQPTERVTL